MSTATATREVGGAERNVLKGLLRERAWEDSRIAHHIEKGAALAEADELGWDGFEWMVVRLRLLPRRPRTYTRRPPAIPDGRYMVEDRRFRVTTPTEGRWKGVASVREQLTVQTETLVKGDERRRVLDLIAADHQAAAAEYGKRTGRCGYCHIRLHDPTSVAYGIGPDCRKKHGIA